MADELVYDIWTHREDLIEQEKYDYITSLAESIKEQGGKDFANSMIETLNEICSKYNICPECGGELDNNNSGYVIHSELDTNNLERVNYLYCPSCGWNNKND